jgi:alkylation response protein AidB-like acyl-CoA dehydrogenase
VRRFLATRAPESAVRRQIESESAWDHALWNQMAHQVGLQALAIPVEHGGSDSGPRALAVVMEEAGRSLLCAPLFETAVLSVAAIRASGDAAVAAKALPAIAAGELTVSMGISAAHLEPSSRLVRSRREAGVDHLDGAERFVSYGGDTDCLLVIADDADGGSLYLVDRDAPGRSRHRLTTLDPTRRAARVRFDAVPARLVGAPGAGAAIGAEVLQVGAVMLAAEQLGGARRVLDLTIDHAKTRVQFGRTIGSFQAVKHRLADLFIALTLAASLHEEAIRALEAPNADSDLTISASALLAGSTGVQIATQAIQVLAGIGFTWEHPAHLYLKRAKASQLLLQDQTFHRRRLHARLLTASGASGWERGADGR